LTKVKNISISSPDSALLIYKSMLKELPSVFSKNQDSLNYYFLRAKILTEISSIYINFKSEFDKALEYSEEAKKTFNSFLLVINDIDFKNEIKSEIGACNINIGKIYEKRGLFLIAIDYYITSLKIYSELNNEIKVANCYLSIGGINDFIGDYDKAKEYYDLALNIFEKNFLENEMAECYYNIGLNFEEQENRDSASFYYQKSLNLYKKLGNKYGIGLSFFGIGSTYVFYDDFFDKEKAVIYYTKALDIFISIGDKFNISEVQSCMSLLFNKIKQFDTAKFYMH